MITPLLAVALGARAGVWQAGEDNAAWRAECGACHMAYPPALLSQDDWRRIMARLDQHFGADASVDAATRLQISSYLQGQGTAGQTIARDDEELPRITQSERFIGKHRSAIRLWNRGKIRSLSDCASCHEGAGQ